MVNRPTLVANSNGVTTARVTPLNVKNYGSATRPFNRFSEFGVKGPSDVTQTDRPKSEISVNQD